MYSLETRRWRQLALGVLVMITISSPQYVWTLFAKPFQAATHASVASVEVTFTVLVVLQTFLSPVFFAWGEIFSLFPLLLTDIFGARHATANYGFLYMAQGVGSLLGGPMAALVHQAAPSWVLVFFIATGPDLTTAAPTLLILLPMRMRNVLP